MSEQNKASCPQSYWLQFTTTPLYVSPHDKSRGIDMPCDCNHDIWLWKRRPCLSDCKHRELAPCVWGCILSNEPSWTGCCTANGFPPVQAVATNRSVPSRLRKATWAAYSNWGRCWMNVKDGILLLRAHCDRGFFIIECVSWSRGQRHTTVPWWAGPGCASSSIMQGMAMARAITRTALSLLLCLPNNLVGLEPHTLFLLDTGLVFQMNKPSQAFRCFQSRALTFYYWKSLRHEA